MFSFICVAWNENDVEKAASVSRTRHSLLCRPDRWNIAFEAQGLLVFYRRSNDSSGEATALCGNRGVVLGTLFNRNGDWCDSTVPQRAKLDERESCRIAESSGRRLVDDFWGWYVAIILDPANARISVLRSPMGDLPCFYAPCSGLTVFFSRLEDVLTLGLVDCTVNWSVIALHIGFGYPGRKYSSAINEITAIESGQCIQIGTTGRTAVMYWDPCRLARGEQIDDFRYASQALRTTTKATVEAWVGLHRSMLVSLSGGLDSSIVLCCLANAPSRPHITGVNYFMPNTRSDERSYARAAAARTNTELVEWEWGNEVALDVIEDIALTPAPVHDVHYWQVRKRERQLALERGASAIFRGSLGDNIFQSNSLMTPAADYLRAHGPSLQLFRVALDVAWRFRVSVWSVLARAIREGLIHRPRGIWDLQGYLLQDGILDPRAFLITDSAMDQVRRDMGKLSHPWLQHTDGVPIGKVLMISALLDEGFYDVHFETDEDPMNIAPFIGQPLVELCLSIPTYMNSKDGWDRAVARDAFASDLPIEIARRVTKGTPHQWLKDTIARNASFVRDFLSGGILSGSGLLDSGKLAKALPGMAAVSGTNGHMLMNLLYTEAWLRAFPGQRLRAAA